MGVTTVNGTRGEAMAYVARYLAELDDVALRHGLALPSEYQDPRERIARLESLVRAIRAGIYPSDPYPSSHYLRALVAEGIIWLEELREREVVSW